MSVTEFTPSVNTPDSSPTFVYRCSCYWCSRLDLDMPTVGPEFPGSAHTVNYFYRLRERIGLPISDELAREYQLLQHCIYWELPSYYAAAVSECGR